MKPLVVVNPRAGSGRAGRAFGEMRPILERALGAIDVAFTERSGHAIAIARDASLAGRALIVAIGGDGTLHEIANGVLDAGNDATAIGFVGQGTGGDFRRSLGLEHRLDRYLDAIASGRERRVDVARVTYTDDDRREKSRWFLNVLSAGLGGLVDRYVESASRSMTPAFAYAFATARAVAETAPVTIACTVHHAGEREERRLDAYMLAVCNGASFGSGMRVAPMAALDDGVLDVVAMTAPTKLAFLALGRKIYTGAHLGERGVTSFPCDAIDLAGAVEGARVLLDIDGESLGALPARIAIAKRALRIRA